jgi:methionine-rich copper-binding protein CopC
MEINNNLVGVPIQQVVNRDRWQEVEADSGSAFDDVIRGHEDAPAVVAGAGFTGCNALDPAGVARISGLDRLVSTFPSQLAPIVAASASGFCPLAGQNGATGTGTVWAEGDILLGGGGSDTFTGRGANDIIDGDHAVAVRISVRDAAGAELGSTDLMENVARSGNFGSGTAGMTLQQAVFAGLVDPGNLRIVREIPNMGTTAATGAASDCGTASPLNCDTAVFSGPRADYDVTPTATGLTVDHARGTQADGIDTLWNVERLQFSDEVVTVRPTVTVTTPAANATNVAVNGNITATFSQVVQGVSGTTFTLRNTTTGAAVAAAVTFNATTRVATLDPNANLAAGTNYTATLTGGNTAIRDLAGNPLVTTSWSFTTAAPAGPTVTARTPAVNATGVAAGSNITATFSEAVQGVSGTTFTLRNTATGNAVAAAVTFNATTRVATLNPNANLTAGTTYTATLTGGATAIRNNAGVPLVTTSWNFTTAAAAAPTVTVRSPAENATAVAAGSNITATFSEAVQGVSGTTFRLTNAATGAAVAAAVTQNGTTNQWILNPTANLASDTQYRVTLTGGATAIRNAAGTPLATVTWTFTTGPAPTVTNRTPGVNATAVARGASPTVTFSEAVLGVDTTTFVIRPAATPNSAPIAATVTRNGTTNQWILNPNALLAAGTQYRVTVTGGPTAIRDAAGNPFATLTWTFTTAG